MATTNNSKKQALGKGIRALLNNIDEEMKAPIQAAPTSSSAGASVNLSVKPLLITE